MKGTKKWNQPLFSYVKGMIEYDLGTEISDLKYVSIARPGWILGRPEDKSTGFQGWIEKKAVNWKWLLNTKYAVHRNDISKAMIFTLINNDYFTKKPNNETVENNDKLQKLWILENQTIKKYADLYNQQMNELGVPCDDFPATDKNNKDSKKDNKQNT